MGVAIPHVVSEDRASGAQIVDGGLRFDRGKTQYLTRTPTSNGNQKTFTTSFWTKLGAGGISNSVAWWGVLNTYLRISSGGTVPAASITSNLRGSGGTNYTPATTSLVRDFNGWYHILLSFDSTQTINTNRWKLYVNGVLQSTTSYDSGYVPQNNDVAWNSTSQHYLGIDSSLSYPFDGHVSQFYNIDGQALDASYFGYTDPLTNVWRPKKFKPQATPNNGTVWSSTSTIPTNPANAFDGDISTYATISNSSGTRTVTTGTFTIKSTLEVYIQANSGYVYTFTINGTPYTLNTGTVGWNVIPGIPANTTVTSFTVAFGPSSGDYINGFRVDGVPLLDGDTTNIGQNGFYLPFDGSAPIGQDQSGRGNNWTPVNFGGSNTIEKATGALPILNTDGGGKVARVGVRTDANASSLVLALPLVGIKSDFSNAINSGTSNKAITATNATGITTASNFYGGSFRFPGNASLTSPSNVDFALSTGDFTIEFWAYPTAYSTYDPYIITNVTNGFYIGKVDTVFALRAFNVGNLVTTTTFPPLNSWTHIAVTRQGTTARIFYNGVLITSGTTSQNFLQGELRIGDDGGGGGASYINSFIQDVRIYKGVAKYTSNFIPASTDPDIVPDSPSGVSYSSNVALVPSTDGAVAFDGTGDYLSIADSTDFAFGSGDFTIECFAYVNSLSATNAIIAKRTNSDADYRWIIWNINTSGQVHIEITTTGSSWAINANTTGTIAAGTWNHIALVRNGSDVSVYINGVKNTLSSGFSGSVYVSTESVLIGVNGTSGSYTYPMNGFISNLQIVKGTALYTSNFTPPSAPISSVANTKLLCCKSNTSATAADVTPGSITANGNAAATNFNPFTVNINTQRGKQSGWATLNPLNQLVSNSSGIENGNLTYKSPNSNSAYSYAAGTISFSSNTDIGYYYEVTQEAYGQYSGAGFVDASYYMGGIDASNPPGHTGNSLKNATVLDNSGRLCSFNSNASYSSSWSDNGTVLSVAVKNNKVWYAINGVWVGGGPNVNGTPATTISTTINLTPFALGLTYSSVGKQAFNFGQKPFKFPPPTGFQPLTLANTPRPTIVRPDQYVGVTTYTGNGATQTVNVGLKPDFIWIKSRNNAYDHQLVDVVRGLGNPLYSNLTNSESTLDTVTATTLNGFTVNGSTYAGTNGNGATFVAWAWKAGGNSNTYNIDGNGYSTASAAGLTSGSITPTGASVNTKSGFSIISFTAQASGSASIPHGLGNTPAFIIVKSRAQTYSWIVYHKNLTSNAYYLILNSTAAQDNTSNAWNSTSPTSSVFTLGSTYAGGGNTVAYLWAEIPGFSKFGSYTGNGNADGPVIITGFRPRWLLIKQSSASGENWRLFDTERDKYNPTQNRLLPNSSAVEAVGVSNELDTLSNGFKLRSTDGASNGSGATYIYAAFAESPTFNLYGAQANAR